MARWGEGDPRWIVEDRPDATNVNNWHWSEKNASCWSKDRLTKLLTDFIIKDDAGNKCKIYKIEKIEGDATANNRKGKLIFFYEWEIQLKWKGKLKNCEKSFKGDINIPNLSEENSLDDIDITITVNESSPDSEKIRIFMYNIGRGKIREQLGIYLKEFTEEYSNSLILPLPEKDDKKVQNDGVASITSGFNKKICVNKVEKTTKPPDTNATVENQSAEQQLKTIDVNNITLNEKFQCTAKQLFDAFTNEDLIKAFSRGDAKSNPCEGGDFVLFGGNIKGQYQTLLPYSKIVQTWRYNQWPTGHFSYVEIELTEKSDHTELKLEQYGVPSSEVDITKGNWKRYYFTSMQQTFGFGSFLR